MAHYDRDKASLKRREQYFKMLEKHPDRVLLMNVGDFYEAYGDSAKALHDILGITTIGIRVSEDVFDDTLDYAMFPFYNIDSYLPKLIHAGKKVGICEPIKP